MELLGVPMEELNEGDPPLALKEETVSLFAKRARAEETTGTVLAELGRGVKKLMHWASALNDTDFARVGGRVPWDNEELEKDAKLSTWVRALRPSALLAARSRALSKRAGVMRLALKLASILCAECESGKYPTDVPTATEIRDLAFQGTWGWGGQDTEHAEESAEEDKDEEYDDEYDESGSDTA